MKEYRPRFSHFRIPEHLFEADEDTKGAPHKSILIRFSRGLGFFFVQSKQDTAILQKLKLQPSARGGMTHCELIDNAGTVVSFGQALCSLSDNFSYAVGRTIALERATHRFKQWLKLRELKEEIQVHGHC